MIGLLAALSASAAAGMRIALPLLVIGLLQSNNLWYSVPILSQIQPQVVLGVLTSWSLFEIFASKKLVGQRVLQIVQLIFSPIVGAIMGIAVVRIAGAPSQLIWIIGVVGGLLALVLQLVKVGWFYRLRGLPIWIVLLEDALCIFLVIFSFKAPKSGGLIALILLWLAIRSSSHWYQWYRGKERSRGRPQQPD
ncbi:MAG: DUF4126 domain-containing protein [Aphanothece sp. CMT-3BRIN-NPC111]|jgi:hypothetical protein|nr:DUF4126 domain-containing protein [Aphanothece sp. CMT-3BRIN-NPC111]